MDTMFDKLKEKYAAQLTLMFQSIDFSNIPGFPNCCNGFEDAYNWLSTFHGNCWSRVPQLQENIPFWWIDSLAKTKR